jgi:N6-adenosine-specific RNA methylase IME4
MPNPAQSTSRSGAVRDPRRLRLHPRADLVPEMRPGEYHALLADIEAHGLREPLSVTPAGVVLDGRHRLRAAIDLNLPSIAVRVVSPRDEIGFIVNAAVHRRHLTPSQIAAIIVQLPDYAATLTASQQRQRANLRRSSPEAATFPPPTERLAELAERYGVGERTLRDAHTIHTLAPDQLALVARGDVPAHRLASRLRREGRDASLTTPPLPNGEWDVVLADPPWQLGNPDSDLAPDQHYPTLPTTEIQALQVPAAEHGILFLWAVSGLLPDALAVVAAWGFTYKTSAVWVKTNGIGPGVWLRNRHELLLVATRGNWSPPIPELRVDSVIEAKRRRHSQKPDQTYELIEQMYPAARRLELYARTPRAGWTAWGNQLATEAAA